MEQLSISVPSSLDGAMVNASPSLDGLLHSVFGHGEFREGQREVCQAVLAGRDALLVMPTGAGKSLCYQLPGLARGGTTLVISPLIALMEDQVAKLRALGTRVARIHSGLSREASRQVCREYLEGQLDFLYIAPERLRVPGFGAMLARRRPTLVAVDEAHCISHWGHDFRADYRTLNQHLPALRPAPVLALTATATPDVQRDIVVQLGLEDPAKFIHGFRRHNLAISVTEAAKPLRAEAIRELMRDPERRPAIVYTSSRREADSLAMTLNHDFRALAYHAGMSGDDRNRVQAAFLAGKAEVIVATVAFGMGVDKADVRTVVHAALPATLESYYQEIGRAGRDGKPSRAVMLHSFLDVKTLEWMVEKDYPPADELAAVHRHLRAEPMTVNELRRLCGQMEAEVFSSALERLIGHGGATISSEYEVTAGNSKWRSSYEAHLRLRREQTAKVQAYTHAHGCRMALLVHHFGDTRDASRDCGVCDWCDRKLGGGDGRELSRAERGMLYSAAQALLGRESMSTGKLQEACGASGLSRGDWDALLREAARAGLFFIEEDSFLKNDERISYRKVSLLERFGEEALDGMLGGIRVGHGFGADGAKAGSTKTKRASTGVGAAPRSRAAGAVGDFDPDPDTEARERKQARQASVKNRQAAQVQAWGNGQRDLNERLRAWRLQLSREMHVPAFFVLSETVLQAVVNAAPRTLADLRRVQGIGPDKVNRFGAEICRIVAAD